MKIVCGNTHMIEPAESIIRAIRASEGFEEHGGCGRRFDPENIIELNQVYRCVECGQWLCKPCILTHFAKTSDHIAAARMATDRRGDASFAATFREAARAARTGPLGNEDRARQLDQQARELEAGR